MKIHQTSGVDHNFGDELNAWLWKDLHPTLFDDTDDGVNFIGIGSILDRRLPATGVNVVLGTGTGYAPGPDLLAAPERWRIYGVRGPLTAALMNLPASAALTDAAILLADHPRWRSRAAVQTTARPIFVPHWKSVRYGHWSTACALAGIDFVDPCGNAVTVIDRIAASSLVVAESMHAAIIADALRVPWVPVILSREVSPFKWSDWSASVGVEYTPLLLAPSSPVERLRARVLVHSAFACIGEVHHQSLDPFPGQTGARELAWSRDQLLADHTRVMERTAQVWRRRASAVAEAVLKRVAAMSRAALSLESTQHLAQCSEAATRQLTQVLAAPSFLSTDAAHQRALARCHEAVAQLALDRRSGKLAARLPGAKPRAMPQQPPTLALVRQGQPRLGREEPS